MRGEIIVAIVSISIILGVAFFIFDIQQFNFTNFLVYNDSSVSPNESLSENAGVTNEDASQAINDSEKIIQELKDNNLSVVYVNDLLIEAKKAFENAYYAEILRGEIAVSEQEREKAAKALISTDWKKINYSDVLNYTGQIKERREIAFQIYDTLTVVEMSLEKYEKKGIDMNKSRDLFEKAKTAFYEDRYQEAEDLLKQTKNSIDSIVSEVSILRDLKKNAINFFQRSWYYILAVLFILAIIIYFGYKQVELNL